VYLAALKRLCVITSQVKRLSPVFSLLEETKDTQKKKEKETENLPGVTAPGSPGDLFNEMRGAVDRGITATQRRSLIFL